MTELRQLKDLRAEWSSQHGGVFLTWSPAEGLSTGCWLHVYTVTAAGEPEHELDRQITANSLLVPYRGPSVSKLTRLRYAVCFSQREQKGSDPALLETVRERLDEYSLEVVAGRGEIEWRSAAKHVGQVDEITLRVDSSVPLERGVLGYRYKYGEREYVYAIPVPLCKGENRLPAVLIPRRPGARDAEIQLCVVRQAYAQNLTIRRKKTGWLDNFRK